MNNVKIIAEYVLESNIINFLIMAGLLYWICKKFSLMTLISKSAENIKNSVIQSEKSKDDAEKKLQAALKKWEKLPAQIKEIENFNKQKVKIFEEKIENSTKKNIENIKKNIETNISIEEKKASAKITQDTIINSVEMSKNEIIEKLKQNPQLHDEFIEESLRELEKAVIQ